MSCYNLSSLIKNIENGSQMKYLFFWDQKNPETACFSQWYPSLFIIDGIWYANAEQYMMAAKARLFKDEEALQKILASTSPREMKSIGRSIKKFDQQVWEQNREQIVYDANMAKFSQNEELKKKLLDTKDKILVEASPVDFIWGIGLHETNPDAYDPRKWQGLNLLGFTLMRIRASLQLI